MRNVLLLAVPLCIITGAVAGYLSYDAGRGVGEPFDVGPSLRASLDTPEHLDPKFTDANGDLVADPPADPAKQIDPATLIFSTLGDDPAREAETWKDFVAHLKKATGKDVRLVQNKYITPGQAATLADGSAHVANLSTGNVPLAVNVGGYVPDCVMADADGKWGYHMEIITPAANPVRSLQDLRGKRVALANVRSHSGFKVPMVTLWTELSLVPERDYQWIYAGTQGMVIQRVKNGDCDAAAVASDFLKREIAAKRISESDFRTVYQSPQTFPPSAFGHVHQLKPELAAKVRDAFLSFKWAGTSLEKAYKAANQSQFVAVNYKDAWASVREIDAQMKKLVDQQP